MTTEAAVLKMRSEFPSLRARMDQLGLTLADPYEVFYNVLFWGVIHANVENDKDTITRCFSYVEALLLECPMVSANSRDGDSVLNLVVAGFLECFWDAIDTYNLVIQNAKSRTLAAFIAMGEHFSPPTSVSVEHFFL